MTSVLPRLPSNHGGIVRTESQVWQSSSNNHKVTFEEHELTRRNSVCSQDGQLKSTVYLKGDNKHSPDHHWNQIRQLSRVTPAAVAMFHKGKLPPVGVPYGVFDVPSPSRGTLPNSAGYDFAEDIVSPSSRPVSVNHTGSKVTSPNDRAGPKSVGWRLLQEKTKKSLFGNVRRFLEVCKKTPSAGRRLVRQKTEELIDPKSGSEEKTVEEPTRPKITGTVNTNVVQKFNYYYCYYCIHERAFNIIVSANSEVPESS